MNEGRFSLVLVERDPKISQKFLPEITKHPFTNGILISNTALNSEAFDLGFLAQFDINDPHKLLGFLKHYTKAFDHQDLMRHHLSFGKKEHTHDIILASKHMQIIHEQIKKIARTQSSVLITGESGTGKEVIAKLIHDESLRAPHPFVAINSCAISPQLLESELFGYEKGAFTGALSRKIGRLEYANHGTFFFDEIAEAPLDLQAKLLRVLQERCLERVGGLESIHLNVRFIAATNRDLEKAITEKSFREDLFYRLNVVPLHLPPLRERSSDIIPLAHSFLQNFARKNQLPVMTLTNEAQDELLKYPWPGNIRELFNVLERSCVLAASATIDRQDLCFDRKNIKQVHEKEVYDLHALEKRAIEKAMVATSHNKTQAAKLLGLSLKTLRAKLTAQEGL